MGRLLVVLVLSGLQVLLGASQSTGTDYDGDQTVGGCLNTLSRLTTQNPSISCLLFKPYLKCLIRVTKLYTYPVGSNEYTDLDNQVNAQLRTVGLNCQFNIEAIAAEVAREQNGRAIPTTAASHWSYADYDRVQTVGDCLNIFDRLTTQNPNLSCSLFKPYLKCLIRVTKLYTYPVGNNEYTALDNQMKAQLRALGFNCQFDIEAIVAEVARETSDKTSPTTAISHWSYRDYDRDQTVGDCLNTFTRLTTQNPNLSCSPFQPYLKCLIRVTKLYTYPVGSDQYTAMDNQMNTQLQALGFNCHFDIEAIAAEVASEQNYRNSDPGFKMSGAGILLLLLSWICSYFVQF